jgi:hypothetical protein
MATNQEKLDEIDARIMGRDIQRWAIGTDVLKLKEVPAGTPGAMAIRSADVLDIIGVLNKLITLQASVDALSAKVDPAGISAAVTSAVTTAVAAHPAAATVDVAAIANAAAAASVAAVKAQFNK